MTVLPPEVARKTELDRLTRPSNGVLLQTLVVCEKHQHRHFGQSNKERRGRAKPINISPPNIVVKRVTHSEDFLFISFQKSGRAFNEFN